MQPNEQYLSTSLSPDSYNDSMRAAWQAAARAVDPILLQVALRVAESLTRPVFAGQRAVDAARITVAAEDGLPAEEAMDLLFLDRMTRRLRALTIDVPPVDGMSRRQHVVLANPTRVALRAAIDIGAVTNSSVIGRVMASDAQLLAACLGTSADTIRGRIDLVALRRFGIERTADLRPRLLPDRPVVADAAMFARLHYLVDELEFTWITWQRTGDWRVPEVPTLPLSHRDARAITGWSAVALDTRLARGRKWDRALDAARVRSGGTAQHEAVTFDAVRFTQWWIALTN
jgi:hypothetical protein